MRKRLQSFILCMGCADCKFHDKDKQSSTKQTCIRRCKTVQTCTTVQRISLQHEKLRLQGEFKKDLDQLQRMVKTLLLRDKHLQMALIEECTWKRNEIHIYEILVNYIKVLEQHKNLLWEKNTFQELRPLILSIFYAKNSIQDKQLQAYCRLIINQFPQLKSDVQSQNKGLVNDEIIQHHRKDRRPSQKMITDFVQQFCAQRPVNLEILEGSGNKFHY